MEKKNLDWGNIGFSYVPTDMRYVADYKNGVWGEGRQCSMNVQAFCSIVRSALRD